MNIWLTFQHPQPVQNSRIIQRIIQKTHEFGRREFDSTLHQSSHGFATRVSGFATKTKALAREIPSATMSAGYSAKYRTSSFFQEKYMMGVNFIHSNVILRKDVKKYIVQFCLQFEDI